MATGRGRGRRVGTRAAALLALALGCDAGTTRSDGTIRIAYVHHARTSLVYRALDDGDLARARVRVVLRGTGADPAAGLVDLPDRLDLFSRRAREAERRPAVGRTTPGQVLAALESGAVDCGTLDTRGLLSAADRGLPLRAVAGLGRGSRERPDRVLVARGDVVGPEAAGPKALRLAVADADSLDGVMAREAAVAAGFDAARIDAADPVTPTQLLVSLSAGGAELAYVHPGVALDLERSGGYRRVPVGGSPPDPGLAAFFLACREEAVRADADPIAALLEVLAARAAYERTLPPSDGARSRGDRRRGREVDELGALDRADYDPALSVDRGRLAEAQRLLLAHGHLARAAPLDRLLDPGRTREGLDSGGGARAVGAVGAGIRIEPGSPVARLISVLAPDGGGEVPVDTLRNVAAPGVDPAQFDQDAGGSLDEAELRSLLARVDALGEGHRIREQENVRRRAAESPGPALAADPVAEAADRAKARVRATGDVGGSGARRPTGPAKRGDSAAHGGKGADP